MKRFLGCDWGTSTFRLRLYDSIGDCMIGEIHSDEGIARMHTDWKTSCEHNKTIDKVEFFQQYLSKQVELLAGKFKLNLNQLPIIISGMASSSIGMADVPYARLPFATNGSDLVIKRFEAGERFAHEIILISGICSDNDVMRGEETQLLGLSTILTQFEDKHIETTFIFPGTHSKHIQVFNRQVKGFKTFMTGELFNIIRHHSILKDSVQNEETNEFSVVDAAAFKQGLDASKISGILNGLFTVRTNQLFEKLDKKQNFYYLSGLLIGEEINYLLAGQTRQVVLCGGSNLFELYKLALDELNLSTPPFMVPFDMVDNAASAGQNIVFKKLF